MDSLTQIVLGAAVGEVVAGKKLGNRAIFWGAVGGTIPDLDALMGPFVTDLQNLLWHRAATHSIVFALIMGPVMGWLLHQFYIKKDGPNQQVWTRLFFWTIFTHPLLDIFTNYGTELFWPFWDYRVAFNTINVVDPIYTLPLLVVMIWMLFLKRERAFRRKLAWYALGISTLYLGLTTVNKFRVNAVVEQNIEALNLQAVDYMTVPSLGNNVLWTVLVQDSSGFYAGYYSIFDRNPRLELTYLPRAAQMEWMEPYKDSYRVNALLDFTKGYYTIEPAEGGGLLINDLRFSPVRGWFFPYDPYIFAFTIREQNGSILIKRNFPYFRPKGADFKRLYQRAKGN